MEHVQKHWGKYVIVIAAIVVLYYGFRTGGWFRAKATPATSTKTGS